MDDISYITKDSDFLDLEIKTSLIQGAGQGIFAKNDIYKNQLLAEYRGPIIPYEICSNSNINEDKLIAVGTRFCIMGRNIASYVNDCIKFDLNKYKTKEYETWIKNEEFPNHDFCKINSDVIFKDNKAFLVATENIKKGQEIYMDYGFSYWKEMYELKEINRNI